MRPTGLVVLLVAVACGLPRDPDGTLERVRCGVVRVGIAESPPWVIVTPGGAEGVKTTLVEAIADSLLYSLVVVPVSRIESEAPVRTG